MAARPNWKLSEPDPRPGLYYCTAVYDRRVSFLSGPFTYHADALADLQRVKSAALDCGDVKAHFAAYGTSHLEGPPPRRVFFPHKEPVS